MSGPQCCENSPTLNPASGSGSVTQLGGLNTYVTGSSDSKRAILLVSDIFGYEVPNLRSLADKVAAAGFYVLVPDFFNGDPFDPESDFKNIPEWLKSHGADKGFEDAKWVIQALRTKGFSAIGAAGFCWGGKVVVDLAKSDDHIQAAVLLHPSLVTVDDFKEVKAPACILGAEFDFKYPPELLKQFGEVLSEKEVKSFTKIFPGVHHGWTVRYDVKNVDAAKSAEESHDDTLDWFAKYVV